MSRFAVFSAFAIILAAGTFFAIQWVVLPEGFLSYTADEDRNISILSGPGTSRHQGAYAVKASDLLPSIFIDVDLNDVPLDGCMFACFHAMILPEDLSTIYHGHPYWMRKGRLVLPLPALENAI